VSNWSALSSRSWLSSPKSPSSMSALMNRESSPLTCPPDNRDFLHQSSFERAG
jgi:hypothetical protein